MHWPEHFPQECPPDEAMPANCEVYRLTDKQQPKEKDFRAYFVLKPEQEWHNLCQACGLSVYTNIEDVLRLKRRVPGARPKWVAKGVLNDEEGVILNTPNKETSHHSWWTPRDRESWKLFIAVLQPDGAKI